MTDTETPMPTINSFYDNETSTEYAVEDTVARQRAEAAQDTAEEALAAAGQASGAVFETTPAWVAHRNTYRGENLGDEYTDEQKAMVAAGTFDDLYIGDYWVMDGKEWMIADINYFLGVGDTPLEQNHLVIVPASSIADSVINDATNQAAYLNVKIKTTTLPSLKNSINSLFSNSMITYRNYFPNAFDASIVMTSGSIWVDTDLDLLTDTMVLGGSNLTNNRQSGSYSTTSLIPNNTQLSIFRLNPNFKIPKDNKDYWLASFANGGTFYRITPTGRLNAISVLTTAGVRPYLLIG